MSSSFSRFKLFVLPVVFTLVTAVMFTGHVAVSRRLEAARQPIQTKTASDPFVAEAGASDKIRALFAAAHKGDLGAKLDLANRYASGIDVGRDDARAFGLFRAIADQYAQMDPRSNAAPQVAEAFRALAGYYRKGVGLAGVKRDPSYANNLLHYSASYFGDAASQFELAKALLEGKGVARNSRLAVQWLENARKKGYAPAQALLGNLLWRGEGIKRLRGEGLGLLAIARAYVSDDDRPWVAKMFEAARAEATPTEVLEANAFIAFDRTATHTQLTNDVLVQLSAATNAINASVGEMNARVNEQQLATKPLASKPIDKAATVSSVAAVRTMQTPQGAVVSEVHFSTSHAAIAKNDNGAQAGAVTLGYATQKEVGPSQ